MKKLKEFFLRFSQQDYLNAESVLARSSRSSAVRSNVSDFKEEDFDLRVSRSPRWSEFDGRDGKFDIANCMTSASYGRKCAQIFRKLLIWWLGCGCG